MQEAVVAQYWKDVCAVALSLQHLGLYYDVRLIILQQSFLSLKEYTNDVENAKERVAFVKNLKLIKLRGPKSAKDLALVWSIETGRLVLPPSWESPSLQTTTWWRLNRTIIPRDDFFRFIEK